MNAVVVHAQLCFLIGSSVAGVVFEGIVLAHNAHWIAPRRNDVSNIALWDCDAVGSGNSHAFETNLGSGYHAHGCAACEGRSATDGTSGTRGGPTRPRAGTQDGPRIVCAFCRKPDTRALRADTLCTGCGSPLHPTSPLGPDARGRALPRFERNHPALLFTHWPQAEGLPAETRDLSPLGVRLVTTASLAVGSLIKLDSDVCRALVRVTSAQRDPADGRCIVGGCFVTVLFSQPRGGFVSLRA